MTLLAHALTATMNANATKNIGKSLDNFIMVRKGAMSKGSVRRPAAVTLAQFDSNWDRIFKKNKPKKEKPMPFKTKGDKK